MQKGSLSLIFSIFVIISLLFGGAYYFSTQEKTPPPVVQDPNGGGLGDKGDAEQSIIAQHRFEDGTHTVYGQVNLPTPCHELDHTLIVRESFPEQVTIELTAVADDDMICAQVITPKEFTVKVDAVEGALITATLNGESIVLNLIRVAPGAAFDSFEALKQ